MATKVTRQREPLTRDQVVEAALRLMDDEGLDAVSMRRVAREVGVEAMSLYNHVRDKEDLLDGVVDLVMREFRFPDEDLDDDPTAYGRAIAHAWRRLLKRHPNVVALFAHRHKPMQTVESLRPMEAALATLLRMGLSVEDSLRAFHVIGGYIMGYVMMETGKMFTPGDRDADVREMERVIPVEQLPCVAASLPHLVECDVDAQFDLGLDLMLEGLRARAARSGGAASPSGVSSPREPTGRG